MRQNIARRPYVFHKTTHASLGDTASTKDLNGIAGGILGGARRVHLEQTDWPREMLRLLLVGLQICVSLGILSIAPLNAPCCSSDA